MKRINLFLLFTVLICKTATGFSQNVFEGHVLTKEGAWCWFADPRALHHENTDGTINSTYIGYIDVHGAIKATQYNNLTGAVNEVLIRSYFQPDDHDNPTFLILPDDRVMIFYSRHTDEKCFYYRITKNPGDITTLGDEKKIVTDHNTTYPSPFILSNDPDHIYLCWRGLNWHPTIGRLTLPDENDNTYFDWGPKQIVQSSGSRPYAKYMSNGLDKIYLTYTTGHPDNENPNFVYFNYINIPSSNASEITLTDVKGKELSTINNQIHNVNKTNAYVANNPDAIVDNAAYRNWTWQVSMDTNGYPVIAMVRINSNKTSHDYYYARWTGNQWQKVFLANGGGHFHQSPGLEMCYSGGMTIDNTNSNQIYCSVPITGVNGKVYEIIKYTVADNGEVTSEAITKNSKKNNARPYSISNGANINLVWMYGDYYDWIVSSSRPEGFPTEIHSDFELPTQPVELEKNLIMHEDFSSPIEGEVIKDGLLESNTLTNLEIIPENSSTEFTVSVSPYISADAYSGRICKIGDIVYGVKASTLKPYIKVGGDTYESTNVLGNSDVWKTENRGTGGQWYSPTKLKFFSLTITYKDGVLRSYINGLLDQSIEIQSLILGDVKVGGFIGSMTDCRVYDRELSSDEIKEISEQLTFDLEAYAFLDIEVPEFIYSDIVLQSEIFSGSPIKWVTTNSALITPSGIVNLPQTPTKVTLIASLGGLEKKFEVTVMPRNIEENKMLIYEFEASDVYTHNNIKYVKDKSGKGNDATLYGNAIINGTLDLSGNTNNGFSSNGYAQAPDGILDDLRSYSVAVKVNPKSLNNAPRIYDFGSDAGNSVFGRANVLTAGFKFNGGTTAMIDSSEPLLVSEETFLVFTFDAKTKLTKIFLDGRETASSTKIKNEPYMLVGNDRNYIGRTQWWDHSVALSNVDFCGTIDEFTLFNIALTEDEIMQLYSSSTSTNQVDSEMVEYRLSSTWIQRSENLFIYASDDNTAKNIRLDIIDSMGRIVQSHNPINFPYNFKSPKTSGWYIVRITSDYVNVQALKLIVAGFNFPTTLLFSKEINFFV